MKPRFWLSVVLLAVSASATSVTNNTQPVAGTQIMTTQIMAWLTGGISSSRLVRLVQERGLGAPITGEQFRQLESAGATHKLLLTLELQSKSSSKTPAQPIPGCLLKAAAAARRQRWHDAELLLRQALAADPQDAALHFALGAMLRQQDQWDDAYNAIAESARLMPDFPENHSAFAYIFFRLDDGPNAIAEARTALSMDPQNAEAYQYLGLGLYSNEQYGASVHAFAESLVRDSSNPDTYYNMGIALHANNNRPAAKAAYEQAIQLRPAFWEAHSNLGLVLHEEGKFNDAIAEYREAKRLAPDEPSVRNNLGNTYCDSGDYDAAIAELRELYREHPEWQQGHGCLASAYMAKHSYDDAIAELQIALEQNPTGSTEHRVLGQALLLENKPQEALREFRAAVSLNPDSDVAHHYLGTALFQQDQLQAAETEFREAVRLNSSAENHYSLAACLMSMQRYEEALAELELASRMAPDHLLYRARRDELMKLLKETNSR